MNSEVPQKLQPFRNWVNSLIRKAGWEVQRTVTRERQRAEARVEAEIRKWDFVRRYQPNTILDVGANTGQFAELIRQVLPTVRIISFEPIRQCFESLQANTKITLPFLAVHSALGNETGSAVIHRNLFSPSSSLLPMKTLHVEELPFTRDSEPETIRIQRLDDAAEELQIEQPFFVKVDVQGFEDQVILGGKSLLASAVAIVLEVSSYSLYEKAPSFDRLYELMKNIGFSYKGNVDQWRSERDGRILQFDALFERSDV